MRISNKLDWILFFAMATVMMLAALYLAFVAFTDPNL
jgi:hypothetical protein